MKRKRILYVAVILSCLSYTLSCRHEIVLPAPSPLSYHQDIAPIMAQYCTLSGCHNPGNYSNIPLATYSNLIQYGQVIPYDPVQSRLYDVLTNGYMPQGDSLSKNNQKLIYDWIEAGALE